MSRTTVATRNAAGVPIPLPKPTAIGTLKSMAEIGAAPVTVRNSTPHRPTALPCSLSRSGRAVTSNWFVDMLQVLPLDLANVRDHSPARETLRRLVTGPSGQRGYG